MIHDETREINESALFYHCNQGVIRFYVISSWSILIISENWLDIGRDVKGRVKSVSAFFIYL